MARAPEVPEILPPGIKGMMPMVVPFVFSAVSRFIRRLTDRFGDEGWKALEEALYEVGRENGSLFQQLLNIDPTDASSIAKVVEVADVLVGVQGEWKELSPERSVKCASYCPIIDTLREKDLLRFCSCLMAGMMKGIVSAMGGKPKVIALSPSSVLNSSCCCEATIEL
jgi:hypothetical protein